MEAYRVPGVLPARGDTGSSPARRIPAIVLLACHALAVPANAVPANAVVPALPLDDCELLESWLPEEHGWSSVFFGLKSSTVGELSNRPACDPVPLGVVAEHFVVLDQRCRCDPLSNRWIELATNVDFHWTILTPQGGFFSFLANDSTLASTEATSQQVLWHPPELAPDETRVITLLVLATNADDAPADKPVTVEVFGTFTIECTLRETTEHKGLGDGAVLERTRRRTDFAVQFHSTPVVGGDGIEEIWTCDPLHHWEELDPIEADFVAGDPDQPVEEFLREDLVLLSAIGTSTSSPRDRDALVLQCVPWQSACTPSPEVELGLSDTLTYLWHSSPGTVEQQFPAGNAAREVVFSTKGLTADQVTVWVEVRGLGLQYPDQELVVARTFPILGAKKRIDAAVIATVADTALPGKAELPPPATWGQDFEPTKFARRVYDPWGKHVYRPPTRPDAWYLGSLLGWSRFHPWEHAAETVADSKNDPPPASFPDLAAVDSWAQPAPGADGAEHRGVYGLHLELDARREVLLELPSLADPQSFELLLEHGWTPMTRGSPWVRLKAFAGTGEWLSSYERGVHRDQRILLFGECSERVSFTHEVYFQLSPTAQRLSIYMTNRRAPWPWSRHAVRLHADGSSTLQHSENGFPTFHVFHGVGGAPLTRIAIKPQMSVLHFIDTGPKDNQNGV